MITNTFKHHFGRKCWNENGWKQFFKRMEITISSHSPFAQCLHLISVARIKVIRLGETLSLIFSEASRNAWTNIVLAHVLIEEPMNYHKHDEQRDRRNGVQNNHRHRLFINKISYRSYASPPPHANPYKTDIRRIYYRNIGPVSKSRCRL